MCNGFVKVLKIGRRLSIPDQDLSFIRLFKSLVVPLLVLSSYERFYNSPQSLYLLWNLCSV